MAKLDLDLTDVVADTGQRSIPPIGDYQVSIVSSEIKATKAGTGQYLQFEMQVLEGPQAGLQITDRFNVVNPNAQAVEIAMGQLKAIGQAVGVVQIGDSSELHDKPFKIRIGHEITEAYGLQADILKRGAVSEDWGPLPTEAKVRGGGGATPPAAGANSAATHGSMPWLQK